MDFRSMMMPDSPVDSLSCICAMVLAWESDFEVPHNDILKFITTQLASKSKDGDLKVMAARTVSALLEQSQRGGNFRSMMHQMMRHGHPVPNQSVPEPKINWAPALKVIFASISAPDRGVVFSKQHSKADLQEAVLGVLSSAMTSKSESVRTSLPEDADQLAMFEAMITDMRSTSTAQPDMLALAQLMDPLLPMVMKATATPDSIRRVCGLVLNIVENVVCKVAPQKMNFEWDRLVIKCVNFIGIVALKYTKGASPKTALGAKRARSASIAAEADTTNPASYLQKNVLALLHFISNQSLEQVSHQRVELLLNSACSLLSYFPHVTIAAPELAEGGAAERLKELGQGFLERVIRAASTEGGLKLFQTNPFEAADMHFFDSLFGDMIEDGHAHDNIYTVPMAKGIPVALTFAAWTLHIPLSMIASPRRSWHWKSVGDESLQSYQAKDSAALTKGISSGAPTLALGRLYEIDFNKMVQRNTKTSNERPIAYSAIPTDWDPVVGGKEVRAPTRRAASSSGDSSSAASKAATNPFTDASMEAMFPKHLLHRGLFEERCPKKLALFKRLSSLVVNPSIIRVSTTPNTSNNQTLTAQQKAELQLVEEGFAAIALQLLGALGLDSPTLLNDDLQQFLSVVRSTANAEVAAATIHYLINHPSFAKDTEKGYSLITASGMLDLVESRLRTLKAKEQAVSPPPASKGKKKTPKNNTPIGSLLATAAVKKSLEDLISAVHALAGKAAGGSAKASLSASTPGMASLFEKISVASSTEVSALRTWLAATPQVLLVSAMQTLITIDSASISVTRAYAGLVASLKPSSVLDDHLKQRVASAVLERFTQVIAALSQKDAERHEALGPWSRDIQTCFRIMGTNVTAEVTSPEAGRPRNCPKCAEPLKLHHSVTWRCNTCQIHTASPSSACRKCDFDLCQRCALDAFGGSFMVDPSNAVRSVTRQSTKSKGYVHGHVTTINGQYAAGSELVISALGRIKPGIHDSWDPLSDDMLNPLTSPKAKKATPKKPIGRDGIITSYTSLEQASKAATPAIVVPSTRTIPVGVIEVVRAALQVLGSTSDVVASVAEGISKMVAKVCCDNAAQMMCKGNTGIPEWCRELLALGTELFSVTFLRECCWYAGVHLPRCSEAMSGLQQRTVLKKAVVPRGAALLPEMMAVMSSGDTSQLLRLDYQFQNEAGTGTGPAQEVYAETSGLLVDDTSLWRDPTTTDNMLFPRKEPMSSKVATGLKRTRSDPTKDVQLVSDISKFSVLGFVAARAFVDNLLVDIALHPAFWLLVKEVDPVRQTAPLPILLEALSLLDPIAHRSLQSIIGATDADLASFDLVLRDDVTAVTRANLDQYCHDELTQELIGQGAMQAAVATRLAFDWIFPVDTFAIVNASTMDELLCGSRRPGAGEKYFTEDDLRAVVKGEHGYHSASVELARLVKIVGGFSGEDQIAFVEFLTGSSRLPPGGLSGLGRPITVVRKDMEGQISKEQTLPSCNTCFLYFKLPSYSTEDIMRERLLMAVREGKKGFALS